MLTNLNNRFKHFNLGLVLLYKLVYGFFVIWIFSTTVRFHQMVLIPEKNRSKMTFVFIFTLTKVRSLKLIAILANNVIQYWELQKKIGSYFLVCKIQHILRSLIADVFVTIKPSSGPIAIIWYNKVHHHSTVQNANAFLSFIVCSFFIDCFIVLVSYSPLYYLQLVVLYVLKLISKFCFL